MHERLNSETYEQWLAELDYGDQEPQASYRSQRADLLTTNGWDRVRMWIQYRLQEPLFDTLFSQMPSSNISASEARLIADYFVTAAQPVTLYEKIRVLLPTTFNLRHVALGIIVGFLGGGGFIALVPWWVTRCRGSLAKS